MLTSYISSLNIGYWFKKAFENGELVREEVELNLTFEDPVLLSLKKAYSGKVPRLYILDALMWLANRISANRGIKFVNGQRTYLWQQQTILLTFQLQVLLARVS